MLSSGFVKYHSELVVFIGHVHIHCAREQINRHADVDIGKSWVDSIEDGAAMWQRADLFIFSIRGMTADYELLHDADLSVALSIVGWLSHKIFFAFNALCNINSYSFSFNKCN